LTKPRPAVDRGSALLLIPAGALVMVLLGSLAVDLSLVSLRQRQALNLAAAAANDAVTVGLDVATLHSDGEYVVRADLARTAAGDAIEHSDLVRHVRTFEVLTEGARATVRLTVEVRYVIARSMPFASDAHLITVEATATAVEPPG
jgi:hypothetical protein